LERVRKETWDVVVLDLTIEHAHRRAVWYCGLERGRRWVYDKADRP
jgi:hypothetical protein